MGIGPILQGRLPTSLISTRFKQSLTQSNNLLRTLQDQVATGQRFFLPSDDPAAAARTILLQKTIERRLQFQTNINTDQSMLALSETALNVVGDAMNQAQALLLSGVGETVLDAEKLAMADEVASLIDGVVNAANSNYNGRYLFGGSESQVAPFEYIGGGVLYKGDQHKINSFIDLNLLMANNVDGVDAFGATSAPIGGDVNPALTLNTKVRDLIGGIGVTLGPIEVIVNDGVNPVQTETVDLSNAETIGDIKTLLENAFAGGPPTLTVDIDPGTNNGIRLTPSGGTVAVADLVGNRVAADLGIASAAAAVINGSDVDPQLTLDTDLAAFNGGTGIGATAGNGLLITNGQKTATVDISSATTVEDLFNILEAANLDLELGINTAGNGLAIATRVSGVNLTIGENNGGANAAGLGIRSMDGTTLLKDVNLGRGVPVDLLDSNGALLPAPVIITRRDGSTSTVDMKGLNTIQQVLDAITAVDGNLTATLNATGNGISVVDTSGTGPLSIAADEVAVALGIDGTEAGPTNTVPLIGKDINPQQSEGVLSLLVQLESALRSGDDVELARLDPLFEQETERLTHVRGDVGLRLQVLDNVENRLLDEEVLLRQSLSDEFDTDMTLAITQIAETTAVLQASLQVAAQSLQLTLLNFL